MLRSSRSCAREEGEGGLVTRFSSASRRAKIVTFEVEQEHLPIHHIKRSSQNLEVHQSVQHTPRFPQEPTRRVISSQSFPYLGHHASPRNHIRFTLLARLLFHRHHRIEQCIQVLISGIIQLLERIKPDVQIGRQSRRIIVCN